jgi:hypothetical protein
LSRRAQADSQGDPRGDRKPIRNRPEQADPQPTRASRSATDPSKPIRNRPEQADPEADGQADPRGAIRGSTERLMPDAQMAGRPAAARLGKHGRAGDPPRGAPGEAGYRANEAT